MRVRVHLNLHTKRWSITAISGPKRGCVIDTRDSVALRDVRLVVSAAGRERAVHKLHKRTVHAWAEGTLCECAQPADAVQFTYNPFTAATFTRCADGAPIHAATHAWFTSERKAYAIA